MPTHKPWPKTGQLHNARRKFTDDPDRPVRTLTYRGKVKLHGTNAAIQITTEGVFAQSRRRILTPDSDNFGFATWVDSIDPLLLADTIDPSLVPESSHSADRVIYGEWVGPGVQKGVALAQLPRKVFAVFAITLDLGVKPIVVVDPEVIRQHLAEFASHPDVYIIDWHRPIGRDDSHVLDFDDPLAMAQVAEQINVTVNEVEEVDPWAHANFGVEGIGEGLVYFPIGDLYTVEEMADLMFKAKGQKHSATKVKTAAQPGAAVLASAIAFTDMFVTDNRLQQAISETNGQSFEMPQIGPFLKWIANDIRAEAADEMEVSGLLWKDVAKSVNGRAKAWFMKQRLVTL